MSYLQNKQRKRKKRNRLIVVVGIILLLFLLREPLFGVFSKASHFSLKPVWIFGNNTNKGLEGLGTLFKSKSKLNKENEELRLRLAEKEARMLNYDSLRFEHNRLKEVLSRLPEEDDFVLATILSKPNNSLYDIIVIDVGSKHGVSTGDYVFALGSIPIGYIEEVFSSSARVVLFSSPGTQTDVLFGESNIFMTLVGRGGGNFEMNIPRDFVIEKSAEVLLPGMSLNLIALVEATISDPRDSFAKAILISPVNIQNLKFVQVSI